MRLLNFAISTCLADLGFQRNVARGLAEFGFTRHAGPILARSQASPMRNRFQEERWAVFGSVAF